MRSNFLTQVTLFALLLWAGMVVGISFLEAPVKFTAPQVTLAIGLGIGRLVFGFLNKFELFFCSVVLVGLFYNRAPFKILFPALLLALVMALQTFWLLPALDVRALQIIAGQVPTPSNLHHVYVGMEVFKLGMLLGTASAVYRQHVHLVTPETSPLHP
ncbi:hypothetical protein [Rufibacter psychrotolerans]|uniref:hypothetical protein n=1 Tax=Rufibacter psychrotolerans TaxID=2812556 RepID=UPI00196813D3|nr:hypothetical protein [Rufibacter sp. SYSU D00308]